MSELTGIQKLIYDSVTPENWLGTGAGHSVFALTDATHTINFSDTVARIPNALINVPGNRATTPDTIDRSGLKERLLQSTSLTPTPLVATGPQAGQALFTLTPEHDEEKQITLAHRAGTKNIKQTLSERIATAPDGMDETTIREQFADELYPHLPSLLQQTAHQAYYSDTFVDCTTPTNMVYDPKTGIKLVDGPTEIPNSASPRERAEAACQFGVRTAIEFVDPGFFARHPNAKEEVRASINGIIGQLGAETHSKGFSSVSGVNAVAATANTRALRTELNKMHQQIAGAAR